MAAPTSYDQIIAAFTSGGGRNQQFIKFAPVITSPTGHAYSTWAQAGQPAAGGFGTALTSRQLTYITVNGGVSLTTADATEALYLTSFGAWNNLGALGNIQLIDRLLDYDAIAANSAASQALTNSASLPTQYSTGDGVMMFLEVSSAIAGVTNGTATITYTNQAGTSGKTTAVASLVAAPVLSRVAAPVTGFFIPLAAGDTGVRSVQSVQFSAAATSGTYCLTLCYPLTALPAPSTAYTERDLVLQSPKMPPIRDNAVLQFLVATVNTTAATNFISGEVNGVSA
jgi:hypothetical protein